MARSSSQTLLKALQAHNAAEERQQKKHDRRLFAIGQLVEKAGLFDVDDLTLKGMLACCADDLVKMQEKWQARGEKLSVPVPVAIKTPARAVFGGDVTLSKHARTALAAEGLKEIRKLDVKLGYGVPADMQLWSGGVGDYDRADSVVQHLGGTLQRLGGAAVALREAAE